MGKDNNNAGIHFIPSRWKSNGSFSGYSDKYTEIIAERNLKKKREWEQQLLDDIQLCNFIVLLEKKGGISHCKCGGKIDFKEGIEVRFHGEKNVKAVKITGKVCRDCGRKYILKRMVIKEVEAGSAFDIVSHK